MKEIRIRKSSILLLGLLLGSSLLTPSCKDDFGYDVPKVSDEAIRIGAGVGKLNATKGYIEDGYGPVNSGTFTLSYPYYESWINSALGTYMYQCQLAQVTFGYAGQEEVGFVNAANPSDGEPKDLVWSRLNDSTNDGIYINKSSGATLYLDNVPKPNNSAASDSIVVFDNAKYSDCKTRFNAGIYKEDGSNDLLWGETVAKKNSQFIEFNLQHCLTRLRLNVEVDLSSDHNLGLTLDNASVRINDIYLAPYKFLRHYGTIEFYKGSPEESIYEPQNLWLVASKKTATASNDDGEPSISFISTWKSKTTTENKETYTTFDFVVPPQNLKTNADRQKLIIRIPTKDVNGGIGYPAEQDSVTFWAYIPSSMYLQTEYGSSTLALNFTRGYDITLNTTMRPGEPELEFMPVTVEEWVNKGEFNPKADQNGIPNATTFYQMMEYYKNYNAFQLTRYGFLNSKGVWDFQFRYENIALEQTRIAGQMMVTEGKPDFIPDFRNRNELLILADGTEYGLARLGNEGQGQLYTILTTEPNSGVDTADKFIKGYKNVTKNNGTVNVLGLIETYQQNSWELGIYGKYTAGNAKPWVFKISGDMTLDYYDIATQMLTGGAAADFSFDLGSYTVTVENAPITPGTGTETLTLTGAKGADKLYEIVSTRQPGLYSPIDFTNLYTAYNANNTANLNLYSVLSGTSRIIPIWRNNITVNRGDIQGMMQVKTGTANQQYSFNFQGNTVDLVQFDGTKTSLSIAAGQTTLKEVMSGPKMTGVLSPTAFTNLASAYTTSSAVTNNVLTEYGYVSKSAWVFEINADIPLSLDAIKGKMVPGTPFSFVIGDNYIVTVKESGQPDKELIGVEGAAELYTIVSTASATDPNP